MKSFASLVVFAVAALGCSSRGGLLHPSDPSAPTTNEPTPPGAAGAGGGAGAGAGGAPPPPPASTDLCGRRSGALALLGQEGADLVFVYADGTSARVKGPGARNIIQQRGGWVAAYDFGSATDFDAQLFDVTGRLRAEASGPRPVDVRGKPATIWRLAVLADGTATFDFSGSDEDVVLSPDGRARRLPFYAGEPDADGWVATDLTTATLGRPALLNVVTGEIRMMSRLAPNNASAPSLGGGRRLYLSTSTGGGAVLVDESPSGVSEVSLPGFDRSVLDVEVLTLPDGRLGAYVTLHDLHHGGLPLWLYDPVTRALSSALPEGVLPPVASASVYGGGFIHVSLGDFSSGLPVAWKLDLVAGTILDLRDGLVVRATRAAPGGAAQWMALTDAAKEVYRYDRATGTLVDLHVAGDVVTAGRRVLVTRDHRPTAVVDLDGGRVTAVMGGASLPAGIAFVSGRWAVGAEPIPTATWAPGIPRWRVDLETGEARAFEATPTPVTPVLQSYAPLFRGGLAAPIMEDGRVGLFAYDGLGVGLFVAAPGEAWRSIGRRARQVSWAGWAGSTASTFALAAEKDCNCYGPLTFAWPTPPAGAPELLSGTSLQFVAADGSDVFPPALGEHLTSFADPSSTCALAKTDAREWLVYDTVLRTRRSIGTADSMSWAAP